MQNNKRFMLGLLFLFILMVFYGVDLARKDDIKSDLVMGGILIKQVEGEDSTMSTEEVNVETYFRPSKLPVLNDRVNNSEFFHEYYGKDTSKITLPDSLLATPKDSILNYYSILRQAANPNGKIHSGCGTIGYASNPYPIAYQFLTKKYQKDLSFKKYLHTFENILHMNLIQLKKVPVYGQPEELRYFVELETIEGSEKGGTYFGYYYGFLTMQKEGNQYRIDGMEFYPEDFLCAPYHGWNHKAELVVDIKYGYWCSMVEERYPTKEENNSKRIYFKGTRYGYRDCPISKTFYR
ncbi:MAG: hypothetical protein K0S47_4430 [Herbinix sp.]|nr:hypothetical protein [Herbinix sp.]